MAYDASIFVLLRFVIQSKEVVLYILRCYTRTMYNLYNTLYNIILYLSVSSSLCFKFKFLFIFSFSVSCILYYTNIISHIYFTWTSLIGKVAEDQSHKWIDINFLSSCNNPADLVRGKKWHLACTYTVSIKKKLNSC